MPKKEFDRIDAATVKERPFYENIYVLFAICRFTCILRRRTAAGAVTNGRRAV